MSKKAFALRLDPAVHAAIERLAAAELRSANAQIEMLLREALDKRGIQVADARQPRRGRPPGRKGENPDAA
ncbi:toxin-antitoxin system HicB family antitoxin [Allopontixanthobacter sp.]|uniref:toxin-antitoxin system HicB family antitoxin n=1 Tax=Allopontixanthobacter sp. TaxID=2906452 RepID=UPI002AB9638E|nr:toxin-antitoxin system HicB family antitoxin [Allopontixanthobacter sp.]MDZ4308579.1 toxin-antitoxin system HicB family antitoxin [Allopontixanthobacter sp.]